MFFFSGSGHIKLESRAGKNEVGVGHCSGHWGWSLVTFRGAVSIASLLLTSVHARKEKGAFYLLVSDPHWSGPWQGVLTPSHTQVFYVANSEKHPWESKIPGTAEADATWLLQPWLVEETLGQEDVRRAWEVSGTRAYHTRHYLTLPASYILPGLKLQFLKHDRVFCSIVLTGRFCCQVPRFSLNQLLAMWPWDNYFNILCLVFIYQIGVSVWPRVRVNIIYYYFCHITVMHFLTFLHTSASAPMFSPWLFTLAFPNFGLSLKQPSCQLKNNFY